MGLFDINGIEQTGHDYSFIANKKYYALGDSIVHNSGTKLLPVTANGQTLIGYTQTIENRYKVVCTNKGQSGHTIVQDYSMLSGLNYSNIALVTIGYGVNDGRTNVTLGTKDSTDVSTFGGALGSLLKKIYNDNKNCRVLVLTPIQRAIVNDWGTYTENNNGNTLEDFAEMCKEVANYYSTPCADLFHGSGINTFNVSSLTMDGVHPNNKGYNRMSNYIVSDLDRFFNVSMNFN